MRRSPETSLPPIRWTRIRKRTTGPGGPSIKAAGIDVSPAATRSTRSKSNCTSLDQIMKATVNGIITLHSASGCAITITGGTEVGHAASGTYSHYNGYKVDVSRQPAA